MAVDLFEFWRRIGPADFVHPADREVFDRLGRDGHGFNEKTLPACFIGPLKSARVVLLFMSPGLSGDDEARAATPLEQARYVERRKGETPLPELDIPGDRWWRERTKCFDVEEDVVAKNVAVLNIGAYHSKAMRDPELLAALPSSRVSLDWAQSILFPEAITGNRVVVCLRSAKFWGLKEGKRWGNLFAPHVTRGGHMHKGEDRNAVIAAVQQALLGRRN